MAERPELDEINRWHKWFGIELNNEAWTLTESSNFTDEQIEEILLKANASAYHWREVGSDMQKALGDALLSRAYAVADIGHQALIFARRSFEFFIERESAAWELAFAHALLAHAGFVAGEYELHERHYPIAKELGDSLEGDDREIFLATFDQIPSP